MTRITVPDLTPSMEAQFGEQATPEDTMTPESETGEQAANNDMTDTEREVEHLRHEIDMLTKGGVIEVAVRNPSVMEYMRHWEGRAEKAEAALAAHCGELEARAPEAVAWRELLSQGFMTCNSNGRGKYWVEVSFATLQLAQAFHQAMLAHPSPAVEADGLVERLNNQAELYERDMGETEAALMREAAAALSQFRARLAASERERDEFRECLAIQCGKTLVADNALSASEREREDAAEWRERVAADYGKALDALSASEAARVALTVEIQQIAARRRSDEMDRDEYFTAGFQGDRDFIISNARAALSQAQPTALPRVTPAFGGHDRTCTSCGTLNLRAGTHCACGAVLL